jgi:ankyrin repeat protein
VKKFFSFWVDNGVDFFIHSRPNPKATMKKTNFIFCIAGLLALPSAFAESPTISTDFFTALRNGDVRQIRAALDTGASINARDEHGNTPLMLAAVYSDVASMKLLLERGAQVNVTNAEGATPLIRASYDFEKTRLLVDRGADVNVRSALGETPLMLAARPVNSHRTVKLLLDHGADAKATNNWGASTLMAAAAGGDVESARLLIEHGANVNAMPVADTKAFIFNGARSPLMWAAYRGDLPMIKALLAAGADINAEGMLGTPLEQSAWNDCFDTCKYLLDHGANPNYVSHFDTYTALHWASSTEQPDARMVNLLLSRGANPNVGGGESIDAFLNVDQTPLMLARKRGDTPVVKALLAAGATNETPDTVSNIKPPARTLPARLDRETVRSAMARAVTPLQITALESKKTFVSHSSHQDCVSCHQQYLPLAAVNLARKQNVSIDADANKELIKLISGGELPLIEVDWQPLFHPDPAYSKGYAFLGFSSADLPASEFTDAWVHHLAAIQEADGHWCSNLPRPPLQSGDIPATALVINALQKYPLPGRKAEFAERVDRARKWLAKAKADNTDEAIYQILGLKWAGESPRRIQSLAKSLLAQQREDGGWAQLPTLKSDAYATGQAIYSLCVGAGISVNDPAIERARKYLLSTQLEDGTWYVHRRAFPFQPTMKSGFPHGRDGWISASATSWAVMALSLPGTPTKVASGTP